MPAISKMWRAAPPAITPVPGAAGLSMTRPAPLSPMTGWVMVEPARATSKTFLRASSMPFCTARPASLALP